MTRRIVITGLGLISSLGNSFESLTENLQQGNSGIIQQPLWGELQISSTVGGNITDVEELKDASEIPGVKLACMSEGSLLCVLAAHQAIQDAGLSEDEIRSPKTGCIVGTGVGGLKIVHESSNRIYDKRANRASPYTVVRTMSNSASANIAHVFPVGGRSYSLSSACSTSLHNIGHAYELIQAGKLDRAIAGGGEDVNELIAGAFAALRVALSTAYNDQPEKASRPYDKNRDGFVLSGGGGIVILESFESAEARGATIYGEIVGFAANSDGYSMVHPEPEGKGAAACMQLALEDAGLNPEEVDYLNTHGTSTVAGDSAEMKAVRSIFGDEMPLISSTKSLGGHGVGAAGAHELIHCLSMIRHGYVAPSINIDELDEEFNGIPLVQETREHQVSVAMSNSFGFGGTNGALIVKSV